MKVFISHSSRDKWIARRISQDLNSFGVETFLDEKDIESGTPIDDTIGEHLKDCDECILLLSPSALTSHWVLIEIGGAKALGKRLVPILLHVGANEIPAPISKHLARDINEIEKYYDEVRQRLAGKPIKKRFVRKRKSIAKPRRIEDIKVGDRVQITTASKGKATRKDIEWLDEMDEYARKKAVVIAVESDRCVLLDIDNGEYYWAFEWLIKER